MQPGDGDTTGALTSELVGQIQDRARSLGLTWQLVKGTVSAMDSQTEGLGVLDGDTEQIGLISMVGPVAVGARVWVMVVPPGGNYIVGNLVGGAAYYSARQTLTAAAASVVFTNIPQDLRRLRISWRARADNAVDVQSMLMRINGDSAAVYFYEYGQAQNAAVTAVPGSFATSAVIGSCTGSTAASGIFGTGQVEIPSWDLASSNTPNWTFVSQAIGIATTGFVARYGGGSYSGTFPWTSLTFLPNAGSFIAGTDIQLEGWPS